MKKKNNKKHQHKKSGQSLVEFVLVVTLFVNLLLVTFNAMLGFAVHQYISYAVFMAARAFQAAGEDPAEQMQRARLVLNTYLTSSDGDTSKLRFAGFGKDLATDIKIFIPQNPASLPYRPQVPSREGSSDTGIVVEFKVPLFEARVGDFGKNLLSIQMKSISYLGREPTHTECQNFFKAFYAYYLPNDAAAGAGSLPADMQAVVREGWSAMDDNGC